MIRMLLLAATLGTAGAVVSAAPAAAQTFEPRSTASLPDDFEGKVQYFGNHSGEVVATVPGTPRRTDKKCPQREGGCPELIGGSLQAELEFDGPIVKGTYRGTGGMRPSTLIGRRSGANCRLFDMSDGSVWSGRCDAEGFVGTVKSVPNAAEQIELSFETVGVNTIDFVERDRVQELKALYDRVGDIAFGGGPGESRLEALLQIHSYSVDPDMAYREGTLRDVERESEKRNSPIYSVYGTYTREDGAPAWTRARFEYDRFICIETSVEPGECTQLDTRPPKLETHDGLLPPLTTEIAAFKWPQN